MKFHRYIGIDYSGSQTPESRLKALQLYKTVRAGQPLKVCTPTEGAKNRSRLEIAQYCLKVLESDELVIIGIDHGFLSIGLHAALRSARLGYHPTLHRK